MKIASILILLLIPALIFSQEEFEWPDTNAGNAFNQLVAVYNTGKLDKVRDYVKSYYDLDNEESIDKVAEYWMDLYYRLGPVKPYSTTINQPHDLEVWLQGVISKTWFAPELILNEQTGKVRASGLLMGIQPEGVETFSNSENEFIEKVKSYLDENEKTNFFQGVVLIQKRNEPLFHEAFGYSDIQQRIENKLETRMRISSITKVITAVAVLQLVQNGKLKLNASIDTYLPELPEHISSKITINHLLVHTSNYELDGIEGFREAEGQCSSFDEIYMTQLEFLPKWNKFEDFDLAKRFDYSNDSYNLLAIILEKITGMNFFDYLKSKIFDPLEMTNTSFSKEGVAVPYRYDIAKDGLANYESKYKMQLSGAGSLISTTSDLLKFHQALISNQLLDFSYTSSLFAPLVYKGGGDYHSLGMTISYSPELNLGHNGTNIGNSAEYRYFPESGYALIVLCNNRSGAQNLYDFFKNNLPK